LAASNCSATQNLDTEKTVRTKLSRDVVGGKFHSAHLSFNITIYRMHPAQFKPSERAFFTVLSHMVAPLSGDRLHVPKVVALSVCDTSQVISTVERSHKCD
jgi:hypothetical protein